MAYFVADEKLQGYYISDGVTINIVKYHFECDDAASLPAQTAFISSKKVKISMASTAHTIDTDALYKMDSSGAWVQQSQPWQPLADYSVLSNKPQINGHTLTGNQSGADFGLQNVLTFDNTPTQDSTNPVTSGGIWTDQQRQETEIGVVANAGAKNVLQFDTLYGGGTSYTTAGVKFDILSDGIVKAERVSASTSDANAALKIGGTYNQIIDNFCNGTFILSGCPSGGGSNTYEITASMTGGMYTKRDYGSGVLLTDKGRYSNIFVQCTVRSSFDGTVIFKPMIRSAAITDPTFQPYAKTNRELTILTDEDRAALVEIVDSGAKNSIDLSKATSVTKTDGMNYTLNADGSVAVSWNLSGTIGVIRFNGISLAGVDATSLVLSGCPSGGGNLSYRLDIRQEAEGSETSVAIDFGESSSFTKPVGDIKVCIRVGKQTGSATFYPMICTQVAWKISKQYQPFRPSWQEMYEMILALQ